MPGWRQCLCLPGLHLVVASWWLSVAEQATLLEGHCGASVARLYWPQGIP